MWQLIGEQHWPTIIAAVTHSGTKHSPIKEVSKSQKLVGVASELNTNSFRFVERIKTEKCLHFSPAVQGKSARQAWTIFLGCLVLEMEAFPLYREEDAPAASVGLQTGKDIFDTSAKASRKGVPWWLVIEFHTSLSPCPVAPCWQFVN